MVNFAAALFIFLFLVVPIINIILVALSAYILNGKYEKSKSETPSDKS